jgi:4-amino-4-deoxy-L-arabinose transferase-like glycosyltransferase
MVSARPQTYPDGSPWPDLAADAPGIGPVPEIRRRSPRPAAELVSLARRYALPVVVGLGLRLWFADGTTQPPLQPGADEYYYRGQAELITHGYWWVIPGTVGHGSTGIPGVEHPPLFSTLLAGIDEIGLHGVDGQRALLCVLSVTAVVCCARIAARLVGGRADVAVAWVAALFPGMWIYSGQVLSESITVPLVAGTVLALYRLRERPRYGRASVLGLLVALCALTRPELVVMVVVFAPLWFARTAVTRRLLLSVVFLAVIVAVVGPWVGRNMHDYKNSGFISANLGSVLLGANCSLTYSGPGIGTWNSLCGSVGPPASWNASQENNFEASIGESYARQNLDRLPAVVAARVGRSLGVWPAPAAQVQWNATAGGVWPLWSSWLYLVGWVLAIPMVVIAAVSLRRRHRKAWPLYSLLALFLVTSALLYANPRFASSCQPAVAVLVGIGLVRTVSLLSRVRVSILPEAPGSSYRLSPSRGTCQPAEETLRGS